MLHLVAAQIVLRVTLALVLLWAGLAKGLQFGATLDTLVQYRLRPFWLVKSAAVMLVAVELATGAALLLPKPPEGASAVATILSAMFVLATGAKQLQGVRVPCGCFGASPTEVTSWATLTRAVLLLFTALTLVYLNVTLGEPSFSHVPGADLVPLTTVACGLAFLLRLIPFLPQAVAYLQEPPVVSPTRGHRVNLRTMPLAQEPVPPSDAALISPTEQPSNGSLVSREQ